MLKKRLIATIFVKDGIAVQSIGFRRFLPLGSPDIIAENLNRWGADEIVLLDISAPRQRRGPDLALVAAVASKCFVPLTIGGGIDTTEAALSVIQSGGDKVAVNSAALERPALIEEIADCLGSQCVVGSIDAKEVHGEYAVMARAGTLQLDISPDEAARVFAASGAGEILISAIHRDGSKSGFDLRLVGKVATAVNIPVIANSGAGHPAHFESALSVSGVSAAAAGNYFNFTEHSILVTKAFLIDCGADLRTDSYAIYEDRKYDESGRLRKLSDNLLSELQFEYYPEEII